MVTSVEEAVHAFAREAYGDEVVYGARPRDEDVPRRRRTTLDEALHPAPKDASGVLSDDAEGDPEGERSPPLERACAGDPRGWASEGEDNSGERMLAYPRKHTRRATERFADDLVFVGSASERSDRGASGGGLRRCLGFVVPSTSASSSSSSSMAAPRRRHRRRHHCAGRGLRSAVDPDDDNYSEDDEDEHFYSHQTTFDEDAAIKTHGAKHHKRLNELPVEVAKQALLAALEAADGEPRDERVARAAADLAREARNAEENYYSGDAAAAAAAAPAGAGGGPTATTTTTTTTLTGGGATTHCLHHSLQGGVAVPSSHGRRNHHHHHAGGAPHASQDAAGSASHHATTTTTTTDPCFMRQAVGRWRALTRAHFPGTLGKRPGSASYAYTLGRVSFGLFAPGDLVIAVDECHNIVRPLDLFERAAFVPDGVRRDAVRKYHIKVDFTVLDHPKAGGLRGTITTYGYCAPSEKKADDASHRLDCWFVGGDLAPYDAAAMTHDEKRAWADLFGREAKEDERRRTFVSRVGLWFVSVALGINLNPVNPAEGRQSYTVGRPVVGHVDVLYVDENLRVTRGNRNTLVVLQRTPKTAKPTKPPPTRSSSSSSFSCLAAQGPA